MISARERMMCPNTPITTPSASAAENRPTCDEAARTSVSTGEPYIGSMQASPTSVDEVADGLRQVGYLPGDSTALVSFLAAKLGKPVLVEGPAGVGKTELAKALARFLNRTLVRLQCYEGLDEAKALYEWNYRKQLLRIQTE